MEEKKSEEFIAQAPLTVIMMHSFQSQSPLFPAKTVC
jgi:hypothetical protein